jgi:tRNA U38,U39,U40 pseudouridine synthase TruA
MPEEIAMKDSISIFLPQIILIYKLCIVGTSYIKFRIKKFVGKHNFINFCKLDVTTTIDFVKTISEASIKEFNYSLLGINS